MRHLAAALGAIVLLLVGGCQLEATKTKVFITRDGRIVAGSPVRRAGEVILEIENNDDARHRPLLIRLDPGREAPSLPRQPDGTLDVGRPGDLEFRGDGYQVVEKLDTMRAFFGSGPRIKTLIHTHMKPGTYVLLDNLGGSSAGTEQLVFALEDER